MFTSKPRGSRIVYVAASARELPGEVQQWLGRMEHRAARWPHIYNALALLATGARPAVMIVSMDAVDWSEMDFFDQAARISRNTRIFVTGHEHHAAKLEAACRRGAMLFDEEAAGEALTSSACWTRSAGMNDILAASLAPAAPSPAASPLFKPVPLKPAEIQETEEGDPEGGRGPKSIQTEKESDLELVALEPDSGLEPTEAPTVRLADALHTVSPETEDPEPAKSPQPCPAEAEAEDHEVADAPFAASQGKGSDGLAAQEQPIPFPWAPHPNRPQRTPPPRPPAPEDPASAARSPALPVAVPPPGSAEGVLPMRPAELTAEELSALMGSSRPPGSSPRESRA